MEVNRSLLIIIWVLTINNVELASNNTNLTTTHNCPFTRILEDIFKIRNQTTNLKTEPAKLFLDVIDNLEAKGKPLQDEIISNIIESIKRIKENMSSEDMKLNEALILNPDNKTIENQNNSAINAANQLRSGIEEKNDIQDQYKSSNKNGTKTNEAKIYLNQTKSGTNYVEILTIEPNNTSPNKSNILDVLKHIMPILNSTINKELHSITIVESNENKNHSFTETRNTSTVVVKYCDKQNLSVKVDNVKKIDTDDYLDSDDYDTFGVPENFTYEGRSDVLEAAAYGIQKMNELYTVLEPKLYSMGYSLDKKDPALYVAAFNAPSEDLAKFSRYGYATIQAATKLRELIGYRTHDGTCNNLNRPKWGSTMTPVQRFQPPFYSDGIQAPRRSVFGSLLPSAREVSALVHEDQNLENPGITHLLMQWGQFVDHDIVSSSQSRGFNGSVPRCCKDGGRDFIPPEFLYGRVQQRRPLLPTDQKDELCRGGAVSTDCFKSGDGRVNEHPGLVAAHIIWLRQHNRMATELSHLNPHWSDEKIYQETRKIVGAMIQHITYKEFLPIVLGSEVMRLFELEPQTKGYYRGYNPKTNPSPASSFGAAAFRFGHSLVQSSMLRFDHFHRPMANKELTNHLFQTPHFDFGMDLAAINIQRGRDHGVPPYTSWREPCGLSAIKEFDDLMRVMPARVARKLKAVYRHVDDIDLFTGGISERPVVDSVQPFVFLSPRNPDNERASCLNSILNNFDLSPWIEIKSSGNNAVKKSNEDNIMPKRTKPSTAKPISSTEHDQVNLTQKRPNFLMNMTKLAALTNNSNLTETDTIDLNLKLDDKLDFKNKTRRYADEDVKTRRNPPQGHNDYDDVQSVQSVVINNVPYNRPPSRPYISVTENIDKYTYLINYVPRPTQSWRQTTKRNYDRDVVKVTYQSYDDTYKRPSRPYYNRDDLSNNFESRQSETLDELQASARSNDDTVETKLVTERPNLDKVTDEKYSKVDVTTDQYKLLTFGYVGTFKGDLSDRNTRKEPETGGISKDFATLDTKKPVTPKDNVDLTNKEKISTFFHYDISTKPYKSQRPMPHNEETTKPTATKYYYIDNVLKKYPEKSNKTVDNKDKSNTSMEIIETERLGIEERSVAHKLSALEDKTERIKVKPSSTARTPSVSFQIIPSENSPAHWAVYDEKEDIIDSLLYKMPALTTDPMALKEVPRPIKFARKRPGRQ
ncbi:unnamed protein product [Leptidea sinapis]|uniref:Uncharacterized protein n=1 Tax=Leptidea sinapis TaxID=189913 RepID=A0A5E4Q761_9NEOP|nr:unnamed protein product [Leptidea sinapis]